MLCSDVGASDGIEYSLGWNLTGENAILPFLPGSHTLVPVPDVQKKSSGVNKNRDERARDN